MESIPFESKSGARDFRTTHWSVVLAAGKCVAPQTDEALAQLCRTYWWPLYAFVRRRGYAAHDAQDLTQEFFTRLLAKDDLRAVDRSKGKFRSFLLAALEHFLANDWRNAHAQKRGGKIIFISIDDDSAEKPFLQVPASNLSAEQLLEKEWAMTLLQKVLGQLRDEMVGAGKGAMFEELKVFLTGEKGSETYAELAMKLATTEAALKMAVRRLRQRYIELLREEVAKTVTGPEEAEDELRAVFAALGLTGH